MKTHKLLLAIAVTSVLSGSVHAMEAQRRLRLSLLTAAVATSVVNLMVKYTDEESCTKEISTNGLTCIELGLYAMALRTRGEFQQSKFILSCTAGGAIFEMGNYLLGYKTCS